MVSKYFSYSQPDFKAASKIANFFGVSVDYLLGRTEVRNPSLGAYPVGLIKKLLVLGIIRAREPIYAEQNIIGWEKVSEEDVRDGEYFFLRVQGNSMIDAHIIPDSLVLVQSSARIIIE